MRALHAQHFPGVSFATRTYAQPSFEKLSINIIYPTI